MSGYIFAVSKEGWSDFCESGLKQGYFTPYTIAITEEDAESSRKRKSRNKILSATLGDFVTMKPGDNVYFLSDRKLYGVGQLVAVGPDCKYDNYIGASKLLPDHLMDTSDSLVGGSSRARWVFFFQPSPYFFMKGVDMDDVLRYRPSAFRMLRAFEGLSFIKIDDEENRALKEFISLANEHIYPDVDGQVFSFDDSFQTTLAGVDLELHLIRVGSALEDPDNKDYVYSEMFIESALLEQLANGTAVFCGHWDHVTHQLIASPFKPLKYIDKIDVFGYRFSAHYDGSPKLITKYLLIELKKGRIDAAAIEQTMQYVDWICQEYASGDYSKVEAYVVGQRAATDIEAVIEAIGHRSYIAESHPVRTEKWNNLHLVKYTLSDTVTFEII